MSEAAGHLYPARGVGEGRSDAGGFAAWRDGGASGEGRRTFLERQGGALTHADVIRRGRAGLSLPESWGGEK